MLANADKVAEVYAAGKISENVASMFRYANLTVPARNSIKSKDIQNAMNSILKRTLDHNQHKSTRPWELVDVTAGLDPAQPWIGFEYETGFDDRTHYHQVINFCWESFDNMAFDREGPGRYDVELTFSPINLSTMMDKNACPIDKLLAFERASGIFPEEVDGGDPEDWGSDEQWGMHVNISTPASRDLASDRHTMVCAMLNLSLDKMSSAAKHRLFGRIPYGLGFCRSGLNAEQQVKQQWMEFKLFNTTGDQEVFDDYRNVTANLTKVIEKLSLEADELFSDGMVKAGFAEYDYSVFSTAAKLYFSFRLPYIRNMANVLSGKDNEFDIVMSRSQDDCRSAIDGAREDW